MEPANNLRIRRGNLADGGSQSDCMQSEILPTEYRNSNSLSCSRERVWFFGPKWQDPVWRELDEAEADPAEQVGIGRARWQLAGESQHYSTSTRVPKLAVSSRRSSRVGGSAHSGTEPKGVWVGSARGTGGGCSSESESTSAGTLSNASSSLSSGERMSSRRSSLGRKPHRSPYLGTSIDSSASAGNIDAMKARFRVSRRYGE
ncbi:hypothetical protein B0H13DRAFT_2013056 [Mycena leptocephala]|nr:hypothetical protein B0H13DRAFT_2013056 [Mycena leptocephala]